MNQHARDFTPEEQALHFGQQRELPGSIEAEQQLLGAILINNAAYAAVMSKVSLSPDHFFEPLHRRIFASMADLVEQGRTITPVTLIPAIPKEQKVGDMTGFQYLVHLAAEACAIILAPQLAEDIIKASVAREAIFDGHELIAAAYDRWGDAGFVDDLAKMADGIRNKTDEARVRHNQRPGDAYMDRFNAAAANSGAIGVALGLKELHKVLNEPVLEAGNLYGLLSSSGEGKTSLTIQIMLHALRNEHPVLFLSYDQSQAQCVAQMIAQEYGIDTKQQKDPTSSMTEEQRDKGIRFATWINSQPIEIIRCQREGNVRLIAYARQFLARHKGSKTPLIVIDHIKKIKPRDDRQSPDKISAEITVEWKALADETKSAVLMLNQRNTEGTKRDNPRPIGRDIYGGEGAKEDYDAVVYLYRPAKYRNDMISTASDDRRRTLITNIFREFGDEDEIETIAEIGAIKVRYGDPSVRQRLKFEARFTRYVSDAVQQQDRMF